MTTCTDPVIDQFLQRAEMTLRQFGSDPTVKTGLSKQGIDVAEFCEQIRQPLPPLRPAGPSGFAPAAAAAPPVVVALGVADLFLILGFMFVAAVGSYYMFKNWDKIIAALATVVEELKSATARLRAVETATTLRPRCVPDFRRLLDLLGRMTMRFSSPVAQPGMILSPSFLRGFAELMDEFMDTLETFIVCQGIDRNSPDWRDLFGPTGRFTRLRQRINYLINSLHRRT